jgi:hypothetical protein
MPAGLCNACYHSMMEFQPLRKRLKPERARSASFDTSRIVYDGPELLHICRKLCGIELRTYVMWDRRSTTTPNTSVTFQFWWWKWKICQRILEACPRYYFPMVITVMNKRGCQYMEQQLKKCHTTHCHPWHELFSVPPGEHTYIMCHPSPQAPCLRQQFCKWLLRHLLYSSSRRQRPSGNVLQCKNTCVIMSFTHKDAKLRCSCTREFLVCAWESYEDASRATRRTRSLHNETHS